jgi:response regulator RpfG family c-di-GMP phosphodiesterase
MALDSLSELKILVVEDNRFMQEWLSDPLKAMNVGVVEIARSGNRAKKLMANNSYDLIIIDQEMEDDTEFLAKPVSAKVLHRRISAIIEAPRNFIRTDAYFGPDRRRRHDPNFVGPKRRKGDK